MRPYRLLAFSAAFILAAAAADAAGVVIGAPVTRVAFQAVLAGQLREYMSLSPDAGLIRLETLSALPATAFPALAVDRAAASSALALIVSPEAARLTEDREARVTLARALGRGNLAMIATAAGSLQAQASGDPAVSAAMDRARAMLASTEGAGIAAVREGLARFFDASSPAAFIYAQEPSAGTGNGGLTTAIVEEAGGFVYEASDAGRVRRFKVYPQDAVTFERRRIPAGLSAIYEELPGGDVRQRAPDPLAAALDEARVELWAVRNAETDSSRAGLLGGARAALSDVPDEPARSGARQSRAAALRMYESLGGDGWATGILAGYARPLVLLISPLKSAVQTAAALQELLDHKSRVLGNGPPRRLYEAQIERGLAELDFGAFSDWPAAKAERLAAWRAFDAHGKGRTYLDRFPGGESRFDVLMRQRGIMRRLARDYRGRQVITFGHEETIAAQTAALGLIERDPADRALRVRPAEAAQPIRLTFPGALLIGAPR